MESSLLFTVLTLKYSYVNLEPIFVLITFPAFIVHTLSLSYFSAQSHSFSIVEPEHQTSFFHVICHYCQICEEIRIYIATLGRCLHLDSLLFRSCPNSKTKLSDLWGRSHITYTKRIYLSKSSPILCFSRSRGNG